MQIRSNTDIAGCDLSHYEDGVDINGTPEIVYLKASEGQHTIDPSFNTLYDNCRAAGRKIGAYHFLHVGGYDIDSQVDFAVATIAGKDFDCLFGIDIEEGGYHGGSPEEVTAQVLDFADKFTAKTGIPCCLYASTAFIQEHLTAAVNRLPLWVADYRDQNQPGDNGIYNTWAGFQYTDTPYDLNEFTTDILISTPAENPPRAAEQAVGEPFGVNRVDSMPYAPNARVKHQFDVRGLDGSLAAGHHVSPSDNICILGVDADRQLCEVVYPLDAGGFMHGYMTNDVGNIDYFYTDMWRNGSTPEDVLDANGCKMGSIDPKETATPLYRDSVGLCVVYNTGKGARTKSGRVKWNGWFNKF